MSADLPQCRVLIAEADRFERERLEACLTSWGYAVESTGDGASALARLTGPEPPTIAFLDSELPEMNCLAIYQALKQTQGLLSPVSRRSFAVLPAVEQSPSGLHKLPTWIVALWNPTESQETPGTRASNAILLSLEPGISDILAKPVREWELRLRMRTVQSFLALKSELEQSKEAVGFQASHDPLTGLWNRETTLSLLFQETARARRDRSPLSVILIDLDHFAQRSLEFGFQVCDTVLEETAIRLRRQLRSYDVLGRSGEDEFLAVMPGCTFEDAAVMAERLRAQAMHLPFHLKQTSLSVRASFGVAESRGRLPLLVLREAERALAAAKLEGRDRVHSFGPQFLQTSPLSIGKGGGLSSPLLPP